MRVIVYRPDHLGMDQPAGWVTSALCEGLTSLGVKHTLRRTRDFKGEIADVAIVNGWTKKMLGGFDGWPGEGKTNRNTIIAAQAAAGKPAWCIERGFLLDRKLWSAMSIGGFCAGGAPGGHRREDGTWSGDFRADGMPSDRWEKLGIELKPWRTGGEYILLCAQVPWDAQVDDGNHLEWLEKTAREIRKHTDRPILFRGHPKAWRRKDPYGDLSAEFLALVGPAVLHHAPATTFEEDLVCAHAVVCYNSNVATLATVVGVPVFTGAPCLADPMAFRNLDMIEDPCSDSWWVKGHCAFERQQWANDLAYRQWHLEEFREALPWLHLMR